MLLNFDRLGWWKLVLMGITLLTTAFLLLPILFIAALSFGSSQWLIFPPPGWTLRWYQELLEDPRWLDSAWTSFRIAIIVTVLSVLLGLVTSFGLNRGRFLFREALKALFLTPMILPVVVLAVALYAFFLQIGLNGTLTGFVISHLVLALPFSILSITNALEGFDKSIEDAAVLCGASPFEAKIRVRCRPSATASSPGNILLPHLLGRSGRRNFHGEPDASDASRQGLVDLAAGFNAGRCRRLHASHPLDSTFDGARRIVRKGLKS